MEMVQQDFNFMCTFEDSVAIHDNALPSDLTGITDMCDKGPNVQDASGANEESEPMPGHFAAVRSAKALQQFL